MPIRGYAIDWELGLQCDVTAELLCPRATKTDQKPQIKSILTLYSESNAMNTTTMAYLDS